MSLTAYGGRRDLAFPLVVALTTAAGLPETRRHAASARAC